MVTWNRVNIGSSNALLPGGAKPLPEPILTSSVRASEIHLRTISQEIYQLSIIKSTLEIIHLKFNSIYNLLPVLMLTNIFVDVDGLLIEHQAIDTQNTNSFTIVPEWFNGNNYV